MGSTPDPVPPEQKPWPKYKTGLLDCPLEFRFPIQVSRKPPTELWAKEYRLSDAITRAESAMRILDAHLQKARSDVDLIEIWEFACCREAMMYVAMMYVAMMHRGTLKRRLPRTVTARLSSTLPDFELRLRVWKALYADAAKSAYPNGYLR
jgi:hypothetical protein